MSRARQLTAAAMLASIMGLAGAGSAQAATSCGSVAFAPNSDSGAFSITAYNTKCSVARAVARSARHVSVTSGPFRYRSHGFTCKGDPSGDEYDLPSVRWRCNKPRHRVLFTQA